MKTIQPWVELRRTQAFKAYSRIIDAVIYKMPNGSEADFYIKQEGVAVCVLALTADNQVVLARQFRPGPSKILLELPGGGVDVGEKPDAAIARELLEETGYKGEIEFVGTCLDDAYSTMERYCYVARNCVKVAEPQDLPNEQTEVALLSIKAFREHLRTGQLTDVEVGYLALDHLGFL